MLVDCWKCGGKVDIDIEKKHPIVSKADFTGLRIALAAALARSTRLTRSLSGTILDALCEPGDTYNGPVSSSRSVSGMIANSQFSDDPAC